MCRSHVKAVIVEMLELACRSHVEAISAAVAPTAP